MVTQVSWSPPEREVLMVKTLLSQGLQGTKLKYLMVRRDESGDGLLWYGVIEGED